MDPTRLQSTKCMTCQQHYDDDNDDDHHHQYSNQLNIQKNHHHSSFRHRLQRIFLPSSPPPPQPLSPLLISSPTMPTNVTMPIPKPYLPVQNRKSLTLTSNTTTKSSSYCDGTIIGEDEMIFPMSDITEEDEEHYQSDTNNNNTKIEYNQQKSDKDLSSSSSSLLAQSKYQSKKPTDSIDSSNGDDISTTISGSATTIKTKSKPIGIIPKISVVPFLRKRSTSDHHSDDEDGQSVDDSQRPDATTSIAASSSSSSLSWKSGSSSGVKAETITSSTATTSAKSKAHELLGKMMTRVTSSSSSSAPKSACNDNRQMLNNRIRCTSPPSTAITSNGRDDDDYNVYHTVHGHPHDNSSNHKVSINSPINYDGLFQPTQTKQPQSNSRTRSHSNVGFSQQMRHSTLMPGRIGIGSSSNRRQSHDYSHSNDIDNGHRSSPNYIQNNSLFDSFRPRSNTEGSRHSNQQINGNNSNVKKTSVMSVFKNNFLNRHSPSPSMTSGTSHNVECTPIDPSINVNLQPTSRNICQTTTRIIDHQPITLSSLSSSSSSSSTSARRRSSAYSRDSGIISAPISPNSVIDPFSVDYTLYNACMRADQSQSTLINNQPHLHHHCHHSNDINNALSNNKLLTTSLNINSNNRPRSRSSSASTMARVFDMFRNRSNSISSTDQPQIIRNRRSNKSNFNHQDSLCDRFEFEDIDENLVYVRFFKFYRCYDIIPVSAKLVVFDTQLAVKKAFFALLSNGIRAAPLWDASKHMFIGMLTVTDFINILLTYYHSPQLKMEELQEHTLDNWRSLLNEKARPLVSVEPDESLFNAIRTLLNNKVHRLPVIDPDTGNVLYILTHKRILKFLFLFYYNRLPMPSYLHKTLRELPQIGTFENIVTATLQTPLTEALSLLIESRISALPIVDKKNKVIDVYAKFDVIHLAADKTYQNLDITVKKALEFRNQSERVIKCNINETLHTILERIVQAEVHRIVVVDMDDHVIGIISLSDLLNFLVLRPVSAKHPLSSDIAITKSTLVEESGEESHGTASVCSHFDEDDIDEDDKRISNTIDNCQLTVSSVGSVLGTASSSSGQCSSSTSSSSSLLCANDDNNNNSKNKNNNKINNKSSSKNDNKVVDSTAKKIYSSAVDTTPDSDTTLRA